jgi:DEAD/DEAH box helicase domain-containing protein
MIPSVLARHLEQGVKDFLRTTFPVTNPFFADLLERFLVEPGNLSKGSYLDIQLPFQTGGVGSDYFPDLPLPFPPASILLLHHTGCLPDVPPPRQNG